MSYKNLRVWKQARSLSVEVHKMTLNLPSYEMFETGRQIRRASKSVRSNIVEGYGRRRYENDYIRFITYARASLDETRDHLDTLYETDSLIDQDLYISLSTQIDQTGRSLYRFLKRIESDNKNKHTL